MDPLLRPGTNHCKCTVCGEYFTTPNNFDMHRKDGACREPGSILSKNGQRKLKKNKKGLWAGVGKPPAEITF